MENKYELIFKSKDFIDLFKNKIEIAKQSIDIELYYFTPDEVGLDILKLLIKKSKEGLKIRILLDNIGSFEFSNSKLINELLNNNINVRIFNSIIPFSKNSKSWIFLRNHRRTIIIDKKILFSGSICIGKQTTDWIETGIFIENTEKINNIQKIFNKTWDKVYHKSFKIGSSQKIDKKNINNLEFNNIDNFEYITQSPLQFHRNIYKYYIQSIKKSRISIDLISPYFSPNQKIIRYLKKASKKGVIINIYLPEKTDWLIADLARNTYIHSLLKNNINIFFCNKMIHSKVAIFDNKQIFIGTTNLDNLSMRYNYECGIILNNKNCIEKVKNHIYTDILINSRKLNIQDWDNRDLFLKIIEKIVYVFRGLL